MTCPVCETLASANLTALLADDTCVAMLSPTPQAPGHIIVVPRKHVDDIFSCDEATWTAASTMARSVAQLANKELGVESVNIFHGSGPRANDHSPHLTLHVVPRTEKTESHAGHKPAGDTAKVPHTSARKHAH